MTQNEISRYLASGYQPAFVSGTKSNGGIFNNKVCAFNESTSTLLHNIALLNNNANVANKMGFLFASTVGKNELHTLGITKVVWYGDSEWETINEQKTFTRGATAASGATTATTNTGTSATTASAPAVGAASSAPAATSPAVGASPAATSAPAATRVDAANFVGAFVGAIAPAVTADVLSRIEPRINEIAASACVRQEITIKKLDGSVKKMSGVFHPLFELLLKMLKNEWNINGFIPYLYGPAGTGKNCLCRQLAEALDVECIEVSRPEMPHDLVGANGVNGYIETQFVHALLHGGLCLFDEVDTWPKNVMEKIHEGLANGVWDIPTLGNIKQHEKFYLVMAGNTAGRGSCGAFKREPLDPATCRRVCSLFMNYDERIELNCCGGDRELLDFFHDLRSASLKCEIRVLTTLSEMTKLRGLVALGVSLPDAMKASFIADLDEDSLNCLYGALKVSGKYKDAFGKIVADPLY